KSDWHSEYGDSLTDAINVTVKPEACQDITRHLELDVTDDPEQALEEFSKLRRLGHFNEALKLFKDRLDHLLDNAYVRVQYGHCLLDMMDIHGLSKLAGLGTGRFFYITSREIHEIYLHLKTENRIWDFKDLCHGVLSKQIELCHWQDPSPINFQFPAYILGSFDTNNTDDVIRAIQRDWNVVGEPISSLVLLEIFTICSMTALQHSEYSLSYSVESLRLATSYFAAAKSVAVEVYNQSPSSLVSRPYLEWVIAKVRLQDSYGTPVGERALLKHLFKCEGTVVVPLCIGSYRSSRGLISYNPAGNESPDWQPEGLPSKGPNKTIE
ncbi:tetratricopeptide repeat domain-containing protein, partial [Colletotrichum asianum]